MADFISSYCHIAQNRVLLNGNEVFSSPDEDALNFLKSTYQWLKPGHPKFFKMDGLSKLAFIAAELLLKEEGLISEKEKDIAVVLSNKASSLDTDRKHQESINDAENYYPSPAVFVHTLPNICIGEISIRHKLYSENVFFVSDGFQAAMISNYSEALLKLGKTQRVLAGWVDWDSDSFEAFLYLTNNQGAIAHEAEIVSNLYQRK